MEPHTHLAIDRAWVGEPSDLAPGAAVVTLTTRPEMAADDRGLVHGGFVFGAADYAAMLAVDDPNVVLGAAETKFTAPVTVGQRVRCVAEVEGEKGKKRIVAVTGEVDGRRVFEGSFTCFVLDQHVLD